MAHLPAYLPPSRGFRFLASGGPRIQGGGSARPNANANARLLYMSVPPKASQPSMGRIAADDIPANRPLPVTLELTSAELAAIAEEIGALGIGKFRFEGKLSRPSDTEIHLDATLGASVTQPCVVTLGPVRTRVDEPVRRRFTTQLETPEQAEYHLREDEDVEVDPLTGEIDLIEIIREALILALPAFPRAEGAALPATAAAPPGTEPLSEEAARPFAALAALKSKMQEK